MKPPKNGLKTPYFGDFCPPQVMASRQEKKMSNLAVEGPQGSQILSKTPHIAGQKKTKNTRERSPSAPAFLACLRSDSQIQVQ